MNCLSFNKNFLKPTITEASHRCTSLPAGRFRRFHFGLGTKNQNFIFCPTQNCEKVIPISPKGRLIRKHRGRTIGELFRLKQTINNLFFRNSFCFCLIIFNNSVTQYTLCYCLHIFYIWRKFSMNGRMGFSC